MNWVRLSQYKNGIIPRVELADNDSAASANLIGVIDIPHAGRLNLYDAVTKDSVSAPIVFLKEHYSVQLLKSNLQKAVRLKKTWTSWFTAFQLLQQDPMELLRRLPIIMVEDVQLCDAIVPLVWLMAAHSKGMRLSMQDQRFLMDLVWFLAEHENACDPPKTEVSRESWISGLCPLTSSINLALILRVAYGGMPGDMQLLIDTQKHCADHVSKFSVSPNTPEELPTVSLPKDHQLVQAVDFHCTPILGDLRQRLEIDKAFSRELRRAMWNYSSSINLRKPHTRHYTKLEQVAPRISWQQIEQERKMIFRRYWNPISSKQLDIRALFKTKQIKNV